MTLVLTLPATDGMALVSDTRKWFRTGSFVDGHCKLVSSRDGLVTGTGSGQLLDHVAQEARTREFRSLIALIARVAAAGIWEYEIADWTLTAERQPACHMSGDHGVGIAVFDGFAFKRTPWVAGSTPSGLPPDYLTQADAQVRPIFAEGLTLNEIRTTVFDVYSGLYPSGLISRDFDFGTHRPGHRLNIERLRIPTRNLAAVRARNACGQTT